MKAERAMSLLFANQLRKTLLCRGRQSLPLREKCAAKGEPIALPGKPWTWEGAAASAQGLQLVQKNKAVCLAKEFTCVYCLAEVNDETISIEHFVPQSASGPNNIHNVMIAFRDCNTGVGDMTAREKIEYIVQRRLMKIMPAA